MQASCLLHLMDNRDELNFKLLTLQVGRWFGQEVVPKHDGVGAFNSRSKKLSVHVFKQGSEHKHCLFTYRFHFRRRRALGPSVVDDGLPNMNVHPLVDSRLDGYNVTLHFSHGLRLDAHRWLKDGIRAGRHMCHVPWEQGRSLHLSCCLHGRLDDFVDHLHLALFSVLQNATVAADIPTRAATVDLAGHMPPARSQDGELFVPSDMQNALIAIVTVFPPSRRPALTLRPNTALFEYLVRVDAMIHHMDRRELPVAVSHGGFARDILNAKLADELGGGEPFFTEAGIDHIVLVGAKVVLTSRDRGE